MKYTIIKDNADTILNIRDNDENHFIPIDESNRHYQEYLIWDETNDADEEVTDIN